MSTELLGFFMAISNVILVAGLRFGNDPDGDSRHLNLLRW
jgi:hypothetical protein